MCHWKEKRNNFQYKFHEEQQQQQQKQRYYAMKVQGQIWIVNVDYVLLWKCRSIEVELPIVVNLIQSHVIKWYGCFME